MSTVNNRDQVETRNSHRWVRVGHGSCLIVHVVFRTMVQLVEFYIHLQEVTDE